MSPQQSWHGRDDSSEIELGLPKLVSTNVKGSRLLNLFSSQLAHFLGQTNEGAWRWYTLTRITDNMTPEQIITRGQCVKQSKCASCRRGQIFCLLLVDEPMKGYVFSRLDTMCGMEALTLLRGIHDNFSATMHHFIKVRCLQI